MCLVEHVFECSVIVVGVRRRDFVGEERRRVQELHVGLDCGLVEVVGLGLITCGEGELDGGVHTLVWQSVQVYHELQELEEEDKGREEVQETERESQVEEKHSREDDHVGGVKDSNILSRSACADDVTLTRRKRDYARRPCALMWVSVEVVSGVRIVQCHAIMDVVIGVRVMEYHAIIDVVIGVCVMLCHQTIDNSGFATFLNFPLRVQILILSSSCINSSSLFPVGILCTL